MSLTAVTELVSAFAGMGVIVGCVPKVVRSARRMGHVMDQWIGSPDCPGVIDRLKLLETRTAELKPNGGSSMADAIVRIEDRLDRIERQQKEGTTP